MKQEKLEQKVIELFERQDFEVKKREDKLEAINDDQELTLKVFSSEKYSVQEVKQSVIEGNKVFVDQNLEEVEEVLENVSIIRKNEEGKEYDLPSYELIGEIAVINELTVEESEAVEGILEHHPSVKTILLKKEPLQGEFRVGKYRKLYGEETETIHKEFGCKFKVDPTVAFFSEREGTERKRVLQGVEDGERILVMFSGVGPYLVFLAKNRDVEVLGVEKNPEAVDFARENVEMNDVGDSVKIIEGDVGEEVPKLGKFDRILMPSPTNADQFLNEAFEAAKQGTTIAFYSISDKEEPFRGLVEKLKEKANEKNFKISFGENRVVSGYSPGKVKVCINLVVNSK